MNILTIIAHPDDEIIGCGGTIRSLANQGHSVYSCIMCAPADARSNLPDAEALRASIENSEKIIGIKESIKYEFKNIQFNVVPHLELVRAIEAAIVKFEPEWIFTHHPGDLNIDHRVCYEASMAAVKLPQRHTADLPPTMIKKVFLFEVLSSTDWASPLDTAFSPNSFWDIKDTFAEKIDSLKCYPNVMKPPPHPLNEDNIEALARLNGAKVGLELAEAFCLIRDVNS